MEESRIDKIVRRVDDLPPLPTTFMKIVELSRKPNASMKDLVDVISLDQAMVMRILRVCNSPFYGLRSEITSVAHGASYLGFSAIQGIAAAQATSGILNKKVDGYQLDGGELYKHSVATALGARIIAEKRYRALKDTAFTGGLLHDVGKLILAQFVSEEFEKIIEAVEKEQISFNEAEQKVLGFDHTELGEKIAAKWKLADNLRIAIRYHHNPSLCKNDGQIAHIVHVADAISMMLGIGAGTDGLNYVFHKESLDVCGLDEKGMEEVTEKLLSEIEDALRSFSG
ncbi:MAG: HDOD domain-containing protein [Thermodesulfobacteriota bacterium]|nr:HDOD domain-containing protein [Thermodesulfobacteriota bacterium]